MLNYRSRVYAELEGIRKGSGTSTCFQWESTSALIAFFQENQIEKRSCAESSSTSNVSLGRAGAGADTAFVRD